MDARHFRVFLADQYVGILGEQLDGRLAFRIDSGYLALSHRPVLSQSFEDDLTRTYWGRKAGELPAYFSNLLPEGRFRRVVEQSIRSRGEGDLGLLVALGSDLPGAVVLAEMEEAELLDAPLCDSDDDTPGREQLAFRFSLAGVQLKFSMVDHNGKLTIPAHGQGGNWLVKVGVPEYPGLAENEFSMLEWARDAGFEVPSCELRSVAALGLEKYGPPESNALAIRRYDREGNHRLHQEDFMQVFGRASDPMGKQKYMATFEELAAVVIGVLGDEGYNELIRRIALAVATGNNDSHLKNWSLLYRDPRRPVFSPLYDQVATVAWASLDRTLALKLAGSREFGRVTLDSFGTLARKCGMDPTQTQQLVRATLESLRVSWERRREALPLSREQRTILREHWEKVPLLRSTGPLA